MEKITWKEFLSLVDVRDVKIHKLTSLRNTYVYNEDEEYMRFKIEPWEIPGLEINNIEGTFVRYNKNDDGWYEIEDKEPLIFLNFTKKQNEDGYHTTDGHIYISTLERWFEKIDYKG